MLTLALDTAGEFGSIALADGDRTLEEVALHGSGGFAQSLFGELDALLHRHSVKLADIELYAAASGPGSFTGVRIGLAAIKGLAEVAGRPAIGISNLEALAEFGTADLRAPVIDARRGEVFAAVLNRAGEFIVAPVVLPFEKFVAETSELEIEWISAGFDLGRKATNAPHQLAGAIARVAIRRRLAGEHCEPAAIEANYVRRSDAEIHWKP